MPNTARKERTQTIQATIDYGIYEWLKANVPARKVSAFVEGAIQHMIDMKEGTE